MTRAGTLIKAAFDDVGSRASEWAGWTNRRNVVIQIISTTAVIKKNNSGRSVQPHSRYFLTCQPGPKTTIPLCGFSVGFVN